MFIIEWVYAVANIVVALLLFLYIGKTSPGLPLGEFHFFLETFSVTSFSSRSKRADVLGPAAAGFVHRVIFTCEILCRTYSVLRNALQYPCGLDVFYENGCWEFCLLSVLLGTLAAVAAGFLE